MDDSEETEFIPFRPFTRESLFNIEKRIAEERAAKVNTFNGIWYTYRRSNSTSLFLSPFIIRFNSKERICFHRSKFFPLRVDPMFEGLGRTRRLTGKYIKDIIRVYLMPLSCYATAQ